MSWGGDKLRRDIEAYSVGPVEDFDHLQRDCKAGHDDDDDQPDRPD